jgi:polysaccharide pyruvyl transferase WcaK-like protein
MRTSNNLFVLDFQLDVDEALEIIRRSYFMLAMRLHAAVFAIMTDTPSVALSYHGKVRGFMEWAGFEKNVCGLEINGKELISLCEQVLNEKKPVWAAAVLHNSKSQVQSMFDMLIPYL